MYILRRGTIFRARCYVNLFIQVSQYECDSLSILQNIFYVNTTPGVAVVALALLVVLAVADGADIYGEIAGISGEDSSGDDIVDFAGKLGVKYTF